MHSDALKPHSVSSDIINRQYRSPNARVSHNPIDDSGKCKATDIQPYNPQIARSTIDAAERQPLRNSSSDSRRRTSSETKRHAAPPTGMQSRGDPSKRKTGAHDDLRKKSQLVVSLPLNGIYLRDCTALENVTNH